VEGWPLDLRHTLSIIGGVFACCPSEVQSIAHWEAHVLPGLLAAFGSRQPEDRLAAIALVEHVCRADQDEQLATTLAGWEAVISTHLPRALKDVNAEVRAAAATAVAEVPASTWHCVPGQQRQMCVRSIVEVASAAPGGSPVRMATLTALGAMALLHSFKHDAAFLEPAVPIFLAGLDDQNTAHRCRAAIAIANTVSTHEDGTGDGPPAGSPLAPQVGDQLKRQLLEAVLRHCGDTDKVAAPALRAVGFLVAALGPALGAPAGRGLAGLARDLLLSSLENSAAPKVQHSACSAVANIMESSLFLDLNEDAKLLRALVRAATTAASFKVRFAAASALAAAPNLSPEISTSLFRTFAAEYLRLASRKHAVGPAQAKHVDKLLAALARVAVTTAPAAPDAALLARVRETMSEHHPELVPKLPVQDNANDE